eukprot:CAMPEP_0182430752 /NCGR_PEP_ID=MMETSP1167-20130531/43063_1 /TAXON_ID=2988 /ORGANISM="Mallomonas Sp, Strain CCMP3275" /LENGTH=571 /DNA_ID=CAMNT_0024616199 /DNA_START=162 /DNA_END=1877 /DNA_ORIENTATION=-
MYFEDAINNPSLLTTNQTHGFEAHYKQDDPYWKNAQYGPTKFRTEERFKQYANAPTKPEYFYEKSEKYWGRSRRKNPFAKAKVYARPSEEKAKEILENYRNYERTPVEYYSAPDRWIVMPNPVSGIIKPNSVMESSTSRELYDMLNVPIPKAEEPRKRNTAGKIRPLVMRNDTPVSSTPLSTKRVGPDPHTLTPPKSPGGTHLLASPPRSPKDNTSVVQTNMRSSRFTDTVEEECSTGIDTVPSPAHGTISDPLGLHTASSRPASSHRPVKDTGAEKSDSHGGVRSFSRPVSRDGVPSPLDKLRESRSTPLGGFSFPKNEVHQLELDSNSVQYKRVQSVEGPMIVRVVPNKKIADSSAASVPTVQTWATFVDKAPIDPKLRCITPQRMSYSSSAPFDVLPGDTASMTDKHAALQLTTTKPSTAPNVLYTSTDAMPKGTPVSAPIKQLSHCEWKPPHVPGKSALRRACEKRELDSLLKTKSRNFPPEASRAVPISVAESRLIATTPSLTNSSFADGTIAADLTRISSTPAVRSLKRGGGDVLGASRRQVDASALAEALSRSSLLNDTSTEYF